MALGMFLLLASAQNFNYLTIQFLPVSLHGGKTRFLFHTAWQRLAGSERLQPDVHLHVSSKKIWDGTFSIRRESFSPSQRRGPPPSHQIFGCLLDAHWLITEVASTIGLLKTILAGFQFIPKCASYFYKYPPFSKHTFEKKRKIVKRKKHN